MKKKVIIILLVLVLVLCGCVTNNPSDPNKPNNNPNDQTNQNNNDDDVVDNNSSKEIEVDDNGNHTFIYQSVEDNTYVYKCSDCNEEIKCKIEFVSGTSASLEVKDNTITFNNISEDTTYQISGTFYGNIVINVSEDLKFELELNEFDLYSYLLCPIDIESADKVTISSKKGSINNIYDLRSEVAEDDISASIYALCDLDIQGKGTLNVKSTNNNGIHTKDDLEIKNLTLTVDCMDNALKGNDSVTIESGTINLIARNGDGIKTTNSSISSKGNQKGTIAIHGGDILIYSATDGIDSSYDVVLDETVSSLNLEIYTDKYSKYSSSVTTTSDSYYYIRSSSTFYSYSIEYIDEDGISKWCNSSSYELANGERGRSYYYYKIDKPSGYSKLKVYAYTSQAQGQSDSYALCSDTMTLNSNFDTIAISKERFEWTNKTTSGRDFGMGGMNEGNSDKKDVSTKGIKSDNQIVIDGGTIIVNSYDDGLHTNNDVTLENNETALGNITINGGNIKIHSNDDGIHADNNVLINGGTINVTNSYEGIEGSIVKIAGGNVSVAATDDGINGTSKTGEAIIISGGTNYIYAGGDGVDSNSQTSYDGILFSGGYTVVISTGNGDSSLDTERGYSYTGGYVLAIGKSGGMSSEATNCSNFRTVATTKSLNLQANSYVVINDLITLKMPCAMSTQVICLGSSSLSITSASSTTLTLDGNGVYWNK